MADETLIFDEEFETLEEGGLRGWLQSLPVSLQEIGLIVGSVLVIIGALLQVSSDVDWIKWLAGVAILITAINIAGGFAVTQRMLEMFRK